MKELFTKTQLAFLTLLLMVVGDNASAALYACSCMGYVKSDALEFVHSYSVVSADSRQEAKNLCRADTPNHIQFVFVNCLVAR